MQEHPGQVRGPPRAAVGLPGAGRRFASWPRALRRTHLSDISTLPAPSTRPTPVLGCVCVRARVFVCVCVCPCPHACAPMYGRGCASVCPHARAHPGQVGTSSFSAIPPSPPAPSPQRKVPCFYRTVETSAGVSCLPLLSTPAPSTLLHSYWFFCPLPAPFPMVWLH